MEKTKCFMCNSEAQKYEDNDTDNTIYKCDYCGKYPVTRAFLDDYKDDKTFQEKVDETKHIFAGYLGESKENRKESFYIGSDNYFIVLEDIDTPKTIASKLEKLLLYCYEINDFIGQEFALIEAYNLTFNIPKELYVFIGDRNRIGIGYTKDNDELIGMFKAMHEMGWINATYDRTYGDYMLYFSLSIKGLFHSEQLLTTNTDSNKVFIAMAFSPDYKEKCEEAIKPACDRCGFEAQKVDDEHYNGNIVDRIIVKIKRSKFVIADYTYDNSGAYYEAGYADGMGLKVIECCEKSWFDKPENKVHLDKRNNNLILYKDYKDLEEQLVERIRATIPGARLND